MSREKKTEKKKKMTHGYPGKAKQGTGPQMAAFELLIEDDASKNRGRVVYMKWGECEKRFGATVGAGKSEE